MTNESPALWRPDSSSAEYPRIVPVAVHPIWSECCSLLVTHEPTAGPRPSAAAGECHCRETNRYEEN